MDEVPVWLDFTPDHTLDIKGSKEVSLKCTTKYKVRATLVLAVFADGKKLPPMIVFKESSGNLPKKIQGAYDSKRIIIKANKKGWMNETLLEEWINEIWAPNIKQNESYILIWDSFAPHKTKKIVDNLINEYDTDVLIIPGGCTPVLQPLDVGINKPVKDKLRSKFSKWMTKQTEESLSNNKTIKSKGFSFVLYLL